MTEWHRIDDPENPPPKDGTWFVICNAESTDDEGEYEVGKYRPYKIQDFVPVDDESGLYRRVLHTVTEWDGFSNFHRATHWRPLPLPPEDDAK